METENQSMFSKPYKDLTTNEFVMMTVVASAICAVVPVVISGAGQGVVKVLEWRKARKETKKADLKKVK